MLQPLVASLQEVPVERGGIVVLLDQLDLQIARIGQRHREIQRARFTLVAETFNRNGLHLEPGADAQHLAPVIHRGFDMRTT